MTCQEIERRIQAGGLTEKQRAELWDALFLTLPEIDELLPTSERPPGNPGFTRCSSSRRIPARRSEMIRAQVADVDFEGGTILIREKKRARGQRTTRRVPLSSRLAEVLTEWLDRHPGGQTLFGQEEAVVRSKTKRAGSTPLTRDEAHDHFKRTLAGSKWKVLRGWHVLRHSFASNCAAKGVDQRLIDSWLGHTTEIRKRTSPDPQQRTAGSGRVCSGDAIQHRIRACHLGCQDATPSRCHFDSLTLSGSVTASPRAGGKRPAPTCRSA